MVLQNKCRLMRVCVVRDELKIANEPQKLKHACIYAHA